MPPPPPLPPNAATTAAHLTTQEFATFRGGEYRFYYSDWRKQEWRKKQTAKSQRFEGDSREEGAAKKYITIGLKPM
jgi:hypothetical protein